MSDPSAQDKRAMRRFPLHLPVKVTAADGEPATGAAETKDLNTHGVCFLCDSALEENSVIEFTITLPAEVTMTEPTSVRCRARVVRVLGSENGAFEIAAAIESQEFVAEDGSSAADGPSLN